MRLTLLILFLLNIGAILLNHGVFWDDWKIYNMSYEGIEEQTWGAGMYEFVAQAHYFLQQSKNPVLVYRLITVVCYGLTALFGYLSLRKIHDDKNLCVLAMMLFIVNPFYAARTTMVVLPYTICLLLFVVAFYLLIRAVNENNFYFRLISLLLFYLSFLTNSLLCFYIIVPIFLRKKSLAYPDFILLPVVFWVIKVTMFPMHGLYELYSHNQIKIDGTSIVLILILISSIVVLLRENSPHRLLFVSIVLLVAGILPYAIVNKLPSFYGFGTRNQLLVPFGFVGILIWILNVIKKPLSRQIVLGFFVAICTYVNLIQQYHYMIGWMKYEALLSEFRQIDNWDELNTIEIMDNTQEYNPTQQEISFFEWNGMAKYVTKTEDRLFIPNSLKEVINEQGSIQIFTDRLKKNRASLTHNMNDYVPNGELHSLTINKTENDLDSFWTLTKLTVDYHFNRASFNEKIPSYIQKK